MPGVGGLAGLAGMAPLLATGPLGIAAVGLGAAGQLFEGLTADAAAKARAKHLQMAAQQALDEAGSAVSQGLQEDDRTQGRAAVAAASGDGPASGSAMAVLGDLQQQSLMKAKSTIYRGQTEARSDLYDAQVAKTEGQDALVGSAISAGSSLLGQFGQASEYRRAMAGGKGP